MNIIQKINQLFDNSITFSQDLSQIFRIPTSF